MKNRIIILLGTTMLLHSCKPNTAEQNNAPATFDHILVIVGDYKERPARIFEGEPFQPATLN